MALPAFKDRAAPRRTAFSILALFSVLAFGLLAISVLNENPGPRPLAASREELDAVDFDNLEQVKEFLTSKTRASAGDQYLYVNSLQ